jgi:hypothetical protein
LSFLGEDFMLGPALKQLFLTLHQRTSPLQDGTSPLTKYEAAVHRELLGILLTEQIERRILDARADALPGAVEAHPRANVEVLGSTLESIGIPSGNDGIFGSGRPMNLEVVLSGGGGDWGSSSTAISCGKQGCYYLASEP